MLLHFHGLLIPNCAAAAAAGYNSPTALAVTTLPASAAIGATFTASSFAV